LGNTTLSLKAIPGCKDIVFVVILAIVTLAMPLWHMKQPWNIRSWSGMILVTSLIFARTAIQHLRNMQNDQILGQKTLPILYGRRTTKIAFMTYLAIAFVITIVVNFIQPTTHPWLVVIILSTCIGYAPFYLWFLQEHFFIEKYKIEPLSEVSFIIISLISLI
jgi:1,4-dihydroxy-2-naphthoate octaprenyltransferase